VPEVLAVARFTSARRFRRSETQMAAHGGLAGVIADFLHQ
jgi:hypothetical protein